MSKLSIVAKVVAIYPHPNPDLTRVEITRVRYPATPWVDVDLVTGKHYRLGDLGVWLKPGTWIPGWLAADLWLVGKKRAKDWFEVKEINIKGMPSPGLWCGQFYHNDKSKESVEHAMDMLRKGSGPMVDGWVQWPHWREGWRPGDSADAILGLRDSAPPVHVGGRLV